MEADAGRRDATNPQRTAAEAEEEEDDAELNLIVPNARVDKRRAESGRRLWEAANRGDEASGVEGGALERRFGTVTLLCAMVRRAPDTTRHHAPSSSLGRRRGHPPRRAHGRRLAEPGDCARSGRWSVGGVVATSLSRRGARTRVDAPDALCSSSRVGSFFDRSHKSTHRLGVLGSQGGGSAGRSTHRETSWGREDLG